MSCLALGGCDTGPKLSPAEVTGLNDEFDGGSLGAEWKVVNADTVKIAVQAGELSMVPLRNVVWYHAAQGPLVYKTVTGNFRVSTVARTRKASNPTLPPDVGYQFGGLMARAPSSDGGKQDHVFNVVGYRGEHLSVETKTTKQDQSFVQGPPWPSPDAELRICRVNGRVYMYKRPIGGKAWEEAWMVKRPDLPGTLQVGLIAYSYTDAFDLRATFESVTFAPVTSMDDCTKDM
ncbi:MAG: hypothetical protein IPK82_31500 [Polyangiaceae bacterium]|nr:hypothetical protein [Polyangiaceae bacterium]